MTKKILPDFECIRQFFTVLTVFLNLSTIKAKPSVGSLPLMLNLLGDDRHLCHIQKLKKKHAQYVILNSRLEEQKSKYTGLAQHNYVVCGAW